MKPMTHRQRKRNSFRARIFRLLNISNFINSIFFLVVILVLLTAFFGFVSQAILGTTAQYLSMQVEHVYQSSMDDDTFKEEINNQDYDHVKEAWLNVLNVESLHSNNMDTDSSLTFFKNYFDFSIILGSTVIYDSNQDEVNASQFEEMKQNMTMSSPFFGVANRPFMDKDGNVTGSVSVRISPEILILIIVTSLFLVFMILIVSFFSGRIVIHFMAKVVSSPLEQLAMQMEDIANDSLEEALDKRLAVKRPVTEILSLSLSTEKIMEKMSEYYQTMMAQNEELEAQRDELESQNIQLTESGTKLQSMNAAYLNRTVKLQNLLDNIGQGFLSYNQNLEINSEYSRSCNLFFDLESSDQDLTSKNIADLLFPNDLEQRSYFIQITNTIFQSGEKKRQLLLPLLPEEIEIGTRPLNLTYKMIRDANHMEQVLLILTDMTQSRQLEIQVAKEKDRLKMMLTIVTNKVSFWDSVMSFRNFVKALEGRDSSETIIRRIHTFKGTFSQYYMNDVVASLDTLENQLIHQHISSNEIYSILEEILSHFEMAIDEIVDYLGAEVVLPTDQYEVAEDRLHQIYQQLVPLIISEERNHFTEIFNAFRHRRLNDLIKMFPDYTMRLAERLGKNIAPFEIEGDVLYGNENIYGELFKSLIHLFRNAIDHGIESPDYRVTKGKDEIGHIHCRLRDHQGHYEIEFEDDGAGLNLNNIYEKGLQVGCFSEPMDSYSEVELMEGIFFNHLSTLENADDISGKGVGLSALKETVNALDGHIELQSSKDNGTRFIITVPKEAQLDIPELNLDHIMNALHHEILHYFDILTLNLKPVDPAEEEALCLSDYTAIIPVRGDIDSLFIFSVDNFLADHLVKKFMFEPDEHLSQYRDDVIGEVANTLLGNSLASLEEMGVYLTIGAPLLVSNSQASIKYLSENVRHRFYQYHQSGLKIFLMDIASTRELTMQQNPLLS